MARAFVFGNGGDRVLFPARMACAGFTVALAVLLGLAAWEMFGRGAGLLALAFFVFDPNVLANGALVTTDIGSALYDLCDDLCVVSVLQGAGGSWRAAGFAGADGGDRGTGAGDEVYRDPGDPDAVSAGAGRGAAAAQRARGGDGCWRAGWRSARSRCWCCGRSMGFAMRRGRRAGAEADAGGASCAAAERRRMRGIWRCWRGGIFCRRDIFGGWRTRRSSRRSLTSYFFGRVYLAWRPVVLSGAFVIKSTLPFLLLLGCC